MKNGLVASFLTVVFCVGLTSLSVGAELEKTSIVTSPKKNPGINWNISEVTLNPNKDKKEISLERKIGPKKSDIKFYLSGASAGPNLDDLNVGFGFSIPLPH